MRSPSNPSNHVINTAAAWAGNEAAENGAWIYGLSAREISAIEAGIEGFQRAELPWQAANRATLPLEGLGDLVARARSELEDGSGLFRIRGLPVERFTLDQIKSFYQSFGDHIGQPVSQSLSRQFMMDIEDEGAKSKDYGVINAGNAGEEFRSSRARAFSTGGLRFHTDRCDVVSLLCVRQAAQGGHSKIASAVAIHNAMLARDPDLLAELFKPYPRSRFGEEAGDASTHYMLPVFAMRGGKFTTHYSRTYIEAAQANEDVPRISEAQLSALDLLDELANQLSFEMTLQPGDIQLLNNHVVYHAREPFVDNEAEGQRRLLLRLWLAMPDSRALPESFEVLFGDVNPGALRGGIWPAESAYELQG